MSSGSIITQVLFKEPYRVDFIDTASLWCLEGITLQQVSRSSGPYSPPT